MEIAEFTARSIIEVFHAYYYLRRILLLINREHIHE